MTDAPPPPSDDPAPWRPLLQRACADGVCTAAALAVHGPDGRVVHDVFGRLAPDGLPADVTTPFDLASLTKVLATTSACLVLVDRGDLTLDAPVGTWLPRAAFGDRTVRELLAHRGGLVPWRPWFDASRQDPASAGLWPGGHGGTDVVAGVAAVQAAALATPPGDRNRRAYTDLGFLALGWVVEAITAGPLDVAVRTLVTGPLGLHDSHGAPGLRFVRRADPVGQGLVERAPTTGTHRPRPFARGQEGSYAPAPDHDPRAGRGVDDDNAWSLDGVAGHAGLFGTAAHVAAVGRAWLDDRAGAGRLARAETVEAFLAVDAPSVFPVRCLGWDRPAATGSSLGRRLGKGPLGALGHLGFTGTSLWLDLDADVAVALLTNRTWRDRQDATGITALRRDVHDAVADRLGR